MGKRETRYYKFPDNLYNDVINCIYQLDNGEIITGSSDKTIKIFELSNKFYF